MSQSVNPVPPSRLQQCRNHITQQAFALYEHHAKTGTLDAVPHLVKTLPTMGEVNAMYQGTPLLQYLKSALQDEDLYVRWSAAYALGNIGEKAAEAVPHLIQALSDEDWDVRRYAAYALGKIGERASEAVPDLIQALWDKHGDVRQSAVEPLGKLMKEAGIRVLRPAVGGSSEEYVTGSVLNLHRGIRPVALTLPLPSVPVSSGMQVVVEMSDEELERALDVRRRKKKQE